jgi:hypothetical protein
MRWEGRYLTILAVALLLLAGSTAGCLKDDDNGNGNGGDGGEVLANAGPDVVGLVGEPVTFNGSASSGKVERYWWDIDLSDDPANLTADLLGSEVQHTYTEAGVYTVTLTVEGKKDKNSTDTLVAKIDLVEEKAGSLGRAAVNDSYEYTLTADVQKVMLTLTYPTTIGTLPPFVVVLDMYIYAGDTQPFTSTVGQLPDQGDTQTKELDLALTVPVANGGFSLEVRGVGNPLGDGSYTLKVEIYYHAV